MKKYLNLVTAFLVLITSTIGLSGCKDNKSAVKPSAHVIVLKFKKPEYKNYILVTHVASSDSLVATRFNHCGEPIGQSEYSPYWELPDNWLLVDWKWGQFPYSAGLTLLTEKTWKDYPTDTFPLPKWPISEPHLAYPVEKLLSVPAADLAEYNKAVYSNEMYGLIDNGVEIDENSSMCDHAEQADSMWVVLLNHLSTVIKNGDMEKISEPYTW